MMYFEFPLPSGGTVQMMYAKELVVCVPVDADAAKVSEMMEVARQKADECRAHWLRYLYEGDYLPKAFKYLLPEAEWPTYRQDADFIHAHLGAKGDATCAQINAAVEKSELYAFGKSLSAAQRKTLGLNLNILMSDTDLIIERFRLVRQQFAESVQ